MPIEWLVLDRNGQKALLISRYGLDAQPYNTEYVYMTWEKSSLRLWLNEAFINKAFTATEREGILLTMVDNSRSQCYSGWETNGGNNTQDKIFLLSCAEANRYSKSIKASAGPTAYAEKQGAGTLWSWLRSPGRYQYTAGVIANDCSLSNRGVDYTYMSIRPALWINLESGIF